MEREAVTQQMKGLKAKAKAARKEGKTDAAESFRHGAERMMRSLKRTAPQVRKSKKKSDS